MHCGSRVFLLSVRRRVGGAATADLPEQPGGVGCEGRAVRGHCGGAFAVKPGLLMSCHLLT